jgi:hypothetical protein
LDFDKFRRDDEIQNQTVKDQRSSVSVHAKIRSDQQSDKIGSPVSPKRRTSGSSRIRIAAGHQHSVFVRLVKENLHQIMRNFRAISKSCAGAAA